MQLYIEDQLSRAHQFLTVEQLAALSQRTEQQIYRAVRAMARRGMCELTLEPWLRVHPIGGVQKRQQYMAETGHRKAGKPFRRPAFCGPDCETRHTDFHKRHWA